MFSTPTNWGRAAIRKPSQLTPRRPRSVNRTPRLLRGRPQNERHAQVDPTRRVEAEKGLPLFADPTGEIPCAAGDDAGDCPAAFDALRGELLLALTAEHVQLRRVHPQRRRGKVVRRDEMRPSADPNPDMPATFGIEGRTVTVDGAGGEDATFGNEERATLGLGVFRLDKRRDKLPGEV